MEQVRGISYGSGTQPYHTTPGPYIYGGRTKFRLLLQTYLSLFIIYAVKWRYFFRKNLGLLLLSLLYYFVVP